LIPPLEGAQMFTRVSECGLSRGIYGTPTLSRGGLVGQP
jgi:hypothetical protein